MTLQNAASTNEESKVKILFLPILLVFASAPVFAQQVLEFTCDSCNPMDPNDLHVAFTLEVLRETEGFRAGDSVRIRNHNALNEAENGAVCVSECDVEGIYRLKPNGTWEYIGGGTGATTLEASSGSFNPGVLFYPTIIPGNAGWGWTFSCRKGDTPVSCATGDPIPT